MKQDNFINLLHFYKDVIIIQRMLKKQLRNNEANIREAFGNVHHYRNVKQRVEGEILNLHSQ